MRQFIHRANVEHFQRLLERTMDEAERHRILALLAEEEAKMQILDEPLERPRRIAI
jgi:hypothetical protein